MKLQSNHFDLMVLMPVCSLVYPAAGNGQVEVLKWLIEKGANSKYPFV